MRDILKTALVLSFFLLLPLNILALEAEKDNRLSCTAKHLDTNEEVAVKTVPAITNKNIATAQWPLGYPTIAINESDFIKLPENARQFIYYHECAHLKFQIEDEYETDCKSLELINENHPLSKINVRKLVETLVKKFGMSRRWSELLQCESFRKL
jgi:hypothetical protein